ncbi:MAG: molybdopterin-dependent oxidoreductase, partial [Betaproteobacteria bacterium]|nr:molybdopterin-dependent oxidoreductase [Betaproteobacteria bacterium]
MTTTTTMPSLPRRDFLKTTAAVAGGLTLELSLPLEALAADKGAPVAHEVTAWVMIHPDDRIVIRVARSEMGQGSFTGLPMLVAEELACDWGKVSAEYASPNEHVRRNRIWQSMSTGGSAAIRTSQEYLRRAGATAREMLIAAAAQQWGVPASECTAANSVITHVPSKREVTFGKVAEAAAKLEPPKEVKLKDPKDWTLIGQSMKRFDIPDKVMGKPVFGIDAVVPGMVYAAIVQCPIFGGKLKLIDSSAAEKMRGVLRIVAVDEWVAVVADNWWRAQQATKKLKIEWDDRGNGAVSSESILEFFKQGLDDPTTPTAKKVGDIAPAFASAAKVVEAEYFAPFLNHATLEPQTCTASIKDGKVEVWTSTQNAEASMSAAAEAAGVKL